MATANSTPITTTKQDALDYRSKLTSVLTGVPSGGQSVVPNSTPVPKAMFIAPVSTVAPVTTSYKAPVASPIVTPAGGAPIAPVAGGGSYSVKAGDSLSKIAQANGMTLAQLLEKNPQYKTNPNLVQIGATLNLGGTSNPAPTVVNPQGLPNGGAPIVDPALKAKQDAQSLAEQAGRAGYTPDQYQALLQSQNTVSKEESDAIARELGIPTVEGELFKKPTQTSQQLFDSAYSTAGLGDIKIKINALNDEIAKERSLLTDAVGTIDENPFLTESSRVGRGKRILDQAEQKINNKLSQIKSYQDLYDAGLTEVNNIVTRNQNDFSTDQTINTAKLNYLQKKAEVQLGQLKDTKLKTANSTGLGSYLTGAESNKAPTTIGNSESGFFKYDPTTKKFVQVVGASAKSQAEAKKALADAENGGGGTTFKPTAEQKALVGRFANSEASKELGFTEADKAKLNSDPNFFYWALQKASEAGIY